MSKLKSVRGTRDIWGEDARRMAHVVSTFRRVAEGYCFQEISTPIFEFTEVFARTLGESSDVVSKEMYTFEDRGGDSITLRPEYTAGIARAYLSEGMKQLGTVKLYGHGPMFRYERPQKGRYRQFHQLDAEIIGAADPGADVEIIALAKGVLDTLGLGGRVTLHLNTLGDAEDRASYRAALVAYFTDHRDALSEDSKARLGRNPLRILDSKDQGDRALLGDAPRMSDYLSAESKAFFAAVRAGLETLGISYEVDEHLVRGLDYYCHTSFEFITSDLGAQGTVIGGGRYDGLIEQMGGPPTPGIGWAGGIERLGMLLVDPPAVPRPVAIIPLGETAEAKGLQVADELRRAGVAVDMAFRGNLKRRMQRANRIGARAAVILGEDELAKGVAALRDFDSGEQQDVPLADLASVLTADN